MENEKNDKINTSSIETKTRYKKPSFQFYGRISKLTAGGIGTTAETLGGKFFCSGDDDDDSVPPPCP